MDGEIAMGVVDLEEVGLLCHASFNGSITGVEDPLSFGSDFGDVDRCVDRLPWLRE